MGKRVTVSDRQLLGKLSSCAWKCLKAEAVRLLGHEDVVPGMIAAIQTHGELLHWHPHIHVLIPIGGISCLNGPRTE